MTVRIEGPRKNFRTAAAIGANLRVKLSAAGVVAVAGIGDVDLGTTECITFAADEDVAINLPTAEGTQKMVASAAITVGARVYQGASGMVAPTGAYLVGIALQAATANNDVIEVLPNPAVAGVQPVVSGSGALVSGSLVVATGLVNIGGAAANIKSATTPGDDPVQLVLTWTAGALTIKAVKHNGTDPTLVDSTSTAEVTYIAQGAPAA